MGGGPAQREGEGGPGAEIGRAERFLRDELGPRPPQAGAVARNLVPAIDRAEEAARAMRTLADEIAQRLGLISRTSRPQDVQEIQRQITQLRRLIQDLDRHRISTEGLDTETAALANTLNENHAAYLRASLTLLDQAARALESGDAEGARRAYTALQQRMQRFATLVDEQHNMTRHGAPPELIQNTDAALHYYGRAEVTTGQERQVHAGRADAAMRIARMFNLHHDTLTREEGAAALGNLLGFSRLLADRDRQVTLEGLQNVNNMLDGVDRTLVAIEARREAETAAAFQAQSMMLVQLAENVRGTMREQLNRLLQQAREAADKIQNNRGSEVSEQERQSIARQMLEAQEMLRTLNTVTSPAVKDQLSTIYVTALGVLAAPVPTDPVQAQAQQRAYSTLMLAASQVLQNQATGARGRAQTEYRTQIVAAATAYANAQNPEDKLTAELQLRRVMSTRMATDTLAAANRLGGDTQTIVQGMVGDVTQYTATASVEGLQRLAAVQRILSQMSDAIAPSQHLDDSVRTTTITIYNRALTVMANVQGNPRIAEAQVALAQKYANRGTSDAQRTEIERLSSSLEQNPARLDAVGLYLAIDSQISQLQQSSIPQAARGPVSTLLEELVRMRGLLSNGQLVSATDSRIPDTVGRMRARMQSDPNFAADVNATVEAVRRANPELTQEAAEAQALNEAARQTLEMTDRRRIETIIDVGRQMLATLATPGLSGAQKVEIAEIFGNALTQYIAGNSQDGEHFRNAALAYARMTNDVDRRGLMAIVREAAGRTPSGTQGMFTEQNQSLLMIYRQRVEYESRFQANDPELRNVRAYFDLALMAARSGDRMLTQTVLDMAVLYASMASIPENMLNTGALRDQRTAAMDFVRHELGDFSRNRDITHGRRLVQVGSGAQGWMPREGSIDSRFTNALIASAQPGARPLMELLGEPDREAATAALRTRLGREPNDDEIRAELANRGISELQRMSNVTGTHMMHVSDIEFERRAAGILGTDDRSRATLDRRISREADRLRAAADRARRSGDTVVADYYDRQAALVSREFIDQSVTDARAMQQRGTASLGVATALRQEGERAVAQTIDIAAERANIERLLALLPQDQQAQVRQQLTQAGDNPDLVRRIHTAVLIAMLPQDQAMQFNTQLAEAARLDVAQMRQRTSQVIGLLPDALRAEFNRRLEAAGQDVQAVRRVYVHLMHIALLQMNAQMQAQNGTALQSQATAILDGLTQFNRSIPGVYTAATRHQENGRLEVSVAVRTLRALGAGNDADMMGNVIMRDEVPPGGGAARRVPVAVTATRAQALEQQARGLLLRGTGLIDQQERIRQARDQGIANATTAIRDANVATAGNLIQRLLARLGEPSDPRRAAFELRIRVANTRGLRADGTTTFEETPWAFRRRQAQELQSIYRDLGALVGVTTESTEDGQTKPLYDAEARYNDYTGVVGLYMQENFDAASYASGRAQFRISSGAARAGNRITEANLRDAYAAARRNGYPPGMDAFLSAWAEMQAGGAPFGAASGRAMDANFDLLQELISMLPAEARARYATRLEGLRRQESGGQRGETIVPPQDTSFARAQMLEELASEHVDSPRGGGAGAPSGGRARTLTDALMTRLPFYDADDYDRRLAEAQRMYDRGNISQAQTLLDTVAGNPRTGIVGDMEVGEAAQMRETDRIIDAGTRWLRVRAQFGVPAEFHEMGTHDESERAKGEREDRNAVIQPVLDALQASMGRSIDELGASADASLAARDSIIRNRNPMRISPSFVAGLVLMLPADQSREYDQRLNEIAEAGGTQRAYELAGRLYADLRSDPTRFGTIVQRARDDTNYKAFATQLRADQQTVYARGRDQQRTVAWTVARLQITAMQDDMRMGDIGEQRGGEIARISSRGVSSSELSRRSAYDRALGREGSALTVAQAYREFAGRRAELALAMLQDSVDYRAYDVLTANVPISAPIFDSTNNRSIRLPVRDWHDRWSRGLGTLSVTAFSFDNQGYRTARSINPIDELMALNMGEVREFTSFVDRDADHQGHVRAQFIQMGTDITDVQLGLIGLRRRRLTGAEREGEGGPYDWQISRWHPTAAEYEQLNSSYSQIMRLRGAVQYSTIGHDSPWGDDPQFTFVSRIAQRINAAASSVRVLQGLSADGTSFLDLSTWTAARRQQRADSAQRLYDLSVPYTERDTDSITVNAQSSMNTYRSVYNVTCGVAEFVVATAGVLLAPVTGGASLVLTVGVGAMGVARGIDTYHREGEMTFGAGFEIGMGVIGMVLPVAGELAGGARLATGAVEVAEELSAAQRLARLGALGRFAARVEGSTAIIAEGGASAANTSIRALASRMVLGAPELTGAQRLVHFGGAVMMVGGGTQFVRQLPQMIDAYERGEIAWFEVAWGGFQALAQPIIQARAAQHFAARGLTQSAEYMPRWRQFVQGMITGIPLQEAEVHAAAFNNYQTRRILSGLSETDRTSYNAYVQRTGMALAPDVQLRVLTEFRDARAQGRVMDFDHFAANSRDIQIASHEAAYQQVSDALARGQTPRLQLTDSQIEYVRARMGGANEADAMGAVDSYRLEASLPRVRNAEDIYQSVLRGERRISDLNIAEQAYVSARMEGRSPTQAIVGYERLQPTAARQRTADTLRQLERAARMRERGERVDYGLALVDQGGLHESTDGNTYTLDIGGGSQIVYARDHVTAATEIAYQAEQVLRANPDFHTLPADRRAALLRNVPENIRQQVGELAFRPEFRRATLREGGPDRATQLQMALERAGYLPNLANRPDVMTATNLTEILAITRNRDLTPADIDNFAINRQLEAERYAGLGTEFGNNMARALEASAEALHAEAARRRDAARAPPPQVEGQAGVRIQDRPLSPDDIDREAGELTVRAGEIRRAGGPNAEERAASLERQSAAMRNAAQEARRRQGQRILEGQSDQAFEEMQGALAQQAPNIPQAQREGVESAAYLLHAGYDSIVRGQDPATVARDLGLSTADIQFLTGLRGRPPTEIASAIAQRARAEAPRLNGETPAAVHPTVAQRRETIRTRLEEARNNPEEMVRIVREALPLAMAELREANAALREAQNHGSQSDIQAAQARVLEAQRLFGEMRRAMGGMVGQAPIQQRMAALDNAIGIVGGPRAAAPVRPPPLFGVTREGDTYQHSQLPGRTFSGEQVGQAGRVRRIAEALDRGDIPTNATAEDIILAIRMRTRDGYSGADQTTRMRMGLEEATAPRGAAQTDVQIAAQRDALASAATILRSRGRTQEAAALEAEVVRLRPAAPAGRLSPRDAVQQSEPEQQVAPPAIAQAILQRGGTSARAPEWLVGGENVTAGGVERRVDTGTILRTIEDSVTTMARGGQETDIIVVTADKRALNQINQLFGTGNGDLALAAYREIMRRALGGAAGEGTPYLIRPSQSGDEVIGVIVVPRGRGQAVREALQARLEEATTAVFNERMDPNHPQSMAHLRGFVRNPRDLVAAAIETSQPVQVRRQTDGSVTARFPDGRDAMITRPDGRREFLPPTARATDDPSFAPGVRSRLGVTTDTEIRPGLEPVEQSRIAEIWGRRGGTLNTDERAVISRVEAIMRARGLDPANPEHVQTAIQQAAQERANLAPNVEQVRSAWDRRGGALSATDREIVDRINAILRITGLDPANPQHLQSVISRVAAERAVIRSDGVAFEIRLAVPDEVQGQLSDLLSQAGKGLAEVLNNSFGIRGLNTFLGHYGANRVVNEVEAAIGSYAAAHGLTIRRLGTMKYVIEGGTAAQIADLHRFINSQLQEHGIGMRVSPHSPTVPVEAGTTSQAALAEVSNGHLVVERRTEHDTVTRVWERRGGTLTERERAILASVETVIRQRNLNVNNPRDVQTAIDAVAVEMAARTDWDGETSRYENANALIAAMARADDRTLINLMGEENYNSLRPVIDLIRSRSDIRNFEDLVFALRDARIGGANGRALEGLFRGFIVNEGAQFRTRLEAVMAPAGARVAPAQPRVEQPVTPRVEAVIPPEARRPAPVQAEAERLQELLAGGRRPADPTDAAAIDFIRRRLPANATDADRQRVIGQAAELSLLARSSHFTMPLDPNMPMPGVSAQSADSYRRILGSAETRTSVQAYEARMRSLMWEFPDAFIPVETIHIDGTTIRIGSPMRLGGRVGEPTTDTAIPIFITTADGQTRMVMTYQSESQASWRRFAGIGPGGSYYKGESQHFQNLDWRIQRALDHVASTHDPIDVARGAARVDLSDFGPNSAHDGGGAMLFALAQEGITQSAMRGSAAPDLSDAGNRPARVVSSWQAGTADSAYGPHFNMVIESANGRYRYGVAVTEDGMFIQYIQDAQSGGITGAGGPERGIGAPATHDWLLTPIIEYSSETRGVRGAELTQVGIAGTVAGTRGGRVRITGMHGSSRSPFFEMNNGISDVFALIRRGDMAGAQARLVDIQEGRVPLTSDVRPAEPAVDAIQQIAGGRLETLRTAFTEYRGRQIDIASPQGRAWMERHGLTERDVDLFRRYRDASPQSRDTSFARRAIRWAQDEVASGRQGAATPRVEAARLPVAVGAEGQEGAPTPVVQRRGPPPLPPAARAQGILGISASELPQNVRFSRALPADETGRQFAELIYTDPQTQATTTLTVLLPDAATRANPQALRDYYNRSVIEGRAREVVGRIANDPQQLMGFADRLLRQDADSLSLLAAMPQNIRVIVEQFRNNFAGEANNPDGQRYLAGGFAERLRDAREPERLGDLYARYRRGEVPSDPLDARVMQYIQRQAGDSAPTAQMVQGAANLRRMAVRLASMSDPANALPFDFVDSSFVQLIRNESAARPGEPVANVAFDLIVRATEISAIARRGTPVADDAAARGLGFRNAREANTALDLARGMARSIAQMSGTAEPTEAQYIAGTLMAQTMERHTGNMDVQGPPAVVPTAPGEAYDQHMMFNMRWGNIDFTVSVYGDRVVVSSVSPDHVVGQNAWPNEAYQIAVMRYIQNRFRDRFAAAFEPVMSQIRRLPVGAPQTAWGAATSAAGRVHVDMATEPRIAAPPPRLDNPDGVLRVFRTGDAATRDDAVRSFAGMDEPSRSATVNALREQGRVPGQHAESLRRQADTLDAQAAQAQTAGNTALAQQLTAQAQGLRQQATRYQQLADYWNSTATYFGELHNLIGSRGAEIAQAYSAGGRTITQQQLVDIYRSSPDLATARQRVMDALGITMRPLPAGRSDTYASFRTLADDSYLFGMIMSGGLLNEVRAIAANGRVVDIAFQNGLVGAYRLTIELPNGERVMLFAKRQDLRPDLAGSRAARLIGAPAPEVIVDRPDGRPLTYVDPSGVETRYGIMTNVRDFNNTVTVAGRDVRVRVEAAESLWDLGDFSNITPARQRLLDMMMRDPQRFLEELGYFQTSAAAAGFYDRHECNVWPMIVRIDEPPAQARQTAEYLRSQGYTVTEGPDGSFSFLRFGAIDSDTFGSYRVQVDQAGNMQMTGGASGQRLMTEQFTIDLHRLFVRLTYEFNAVEIQRAAAEGRTPRMRTVQQIITEAFGQNMDGPFARGMRRWLGEFDPNTPAGQAFQQRMLTLMQGYDGQPSGMGSPLSPDMMHQLETNGITYAGGAFNGEQHTPITGRDGRATFRSAYEASQRPSIGEELPAWMAAAVPDGQGRFLVRVDDMPSAARRDLLSSLRAGGVTPTTIRTSRIGGREFLVLEQSQVGRVPSTSRGSVIGVFRQGNQLFSYNGGAISTALPQEGRPYAILPLDGVPAADARRLSRVAGVRTLELGVGTQRRYLVFEDPNAIPQQLRSRAETVVRSGDTLRGSQGMGQRLGITSVSMGAAPIFLGMMRMGDPAWTQMWDTVRTGLLNEEQSQGNAAFGGTGDRNGYIYLRVPAVDPALVPPEYGGPARQTPPPPLRQMAPSPPRRQAQAPVVQPQVQAPPQVDVAQVIRNRNTNFEAVLTGRSTNQQGQEVLIFGGGRTGIPEQRLSREEFARAVEASSYAELVYNRRMQIDDVPEGLRDIVRRLATREFAGADNFRKLGIALEAARELGEQPTQRVQQPLDQAPTPRLEPVVPSQRQQVEQRQPLSSDQRNMLSGFARNPTELMSFFNRLNASDPAAMQIFAALPEQVRILINEAREDLLRAHDDSLRREILSDDIVPRINNYLEIERIGSLYERYRNGEVPSNPNDARLMDYIRNRAGNGPPSMTLLAEAVLVSSMRRASEPAAPAQRAPVETPQSLLWENYSQRHAALLAALDEGQRGMIRDTIAGIRQEIIRSIDNMTDADIPARYRGSGQTLDQIKAYMREQVLSSFDAIVSHHLLRVEGLSETQRASELAMFRPGLEQLARWAMRDPEHLDVRLRFIRTNDRSIEMGYLASLNLSFDARSVAVRDVHPDLTVETNIQFAIRDLGQGATPQQIFEAGIGQIPAEWLSGTSRQQLIDLFRTDRLAAIRRVNELLSGHGFAVLRLRGNIDFAAVIGEATLGTSGIRGMRVQPISNENFFQDSGGYFDSQLNIVALRVEFGAFNRESFLHEIQHLFDHVATLHLSYHDGEVTAVARELMEFTTTGFGGRTLNYSEVVSARINELLENPTYRAAAERARNALMTGEDGRPDPQWATRPREILQGRLARLIDSIYLEAVGFTFRDIFNMGVEARAPVPSPRVTPTPQVVMSPRPIAVDIAAPGGRISIDAHFPPGEFARLHPAPTDVPIYHNMEHTQNVTQMTYDLAIARGLPREQAVFLAQVAMLHDIDPTRTPGRPARVAATLEWMRSPDGQSLMRSWGWGTREMAMAEAMIQRTEFPFDNARVGQPTAIGPRRAPGTFDADASLGTGARDRIGGYYDQHSPRQRYIDLLNNPNLSAEDRAFILREAGMLSTYSDQASGYFQPPRIVMTAVRGLGTELGFDPIPGTRAFLDAIGRTGGFDVDIGIARELGIPEPQFLYMQDVLARLTPDQRTNWETTRRVFGLAEAYSKGDQLTAARATELGIGPSERSFLARLRARVSSGEITAQQVPEEIIRFVEGAQRGPPPLRGVIREGDTYRHADLAGRTFTVDQVNNASVLRGLAETVSRGEALPAGTTGANASLARRIAAHPDFASGNDQVRMRIALEISTAPIQGPPPLRGVVREGETYRHVDLPGRTFTVEQVNIASVLRGLAETVSRREPLPAGTTDANAALARRIAAHPDFASGNDQVRMRIALEISTEGPRGPAGPQGGPPGSGPRIQTGLTQTTTQQLPLDRPEGRAELASRILSSDQQVSSAARSRYQSLPEEQKATIGFEIAYQLRLDTRNGVRDFALAVLQHQPAALAQLDLLPLPVRRQIESLSGEPRSPGDPASRFRVPRTREDAVLDAWNQINNVLPTRGAMEVRQPPAMAGRRAGRRPDMVPQGRGQSGAQGRALARAGRAGFRGSQEEQSSTAVSSLATDSRVRSRFIERAATVLDVHPEELNVADDLGAAARLPGTRDRDGNLVRSSGRVTLTEFGGYPGIFRVEIQMADGSARQFIFKAREFTDQALALDAYRMIGLPRPRTELVEGGVIQQMVGIGRPEEFVPILEPTERAGVFRGLGDNAVIDLALGIPDSHSGNFRLVETETVVDGRTVRQYGVIRIDLENAGIGWGQGTAPGTTRAIRPNADTEKFWDQTILMLYQGTGDLRAVVAGVDQGIARITGLSDPQISQIIGRFGQDVGSEFSRGELTQQRVDAVQQRMADIRRDPQLARYQMLEPMLDIWYRAARSPDQANNAALAAEARQIFTEMMAGARPDIAIRARTRFVEMAETGRRSGNPQMTEFAQSAIAIIDAGQRR